MDRRLLSYFPVFIFSIFCFLSSIFCFSAYADKIYLKSGKVYDGKLLGKSDRRYLFSVDFSGEKMPISFFVETVEKIELGKDSVDQQTPYLKEVDSMEVSVKEQESKVYEFSLYKKGLGGAGTVNFTDVQVRKILNKEEFEYYDKFNGINRKYADKFSAIDSIYENLTTATKEDFLAAKQYMDGLYFELNGLVVPAMFKKSHITYLQSVKATYLAFDALEQGILEEAAKQIKISQETKETSLLLFREILMSKQASMPQAVKAAEKTEEKTDTITTGQNETKDPK